MHGIHTVPSRVESGNTKGASITVPLTSCLTSLDSSVLKIKTKIVSCHTADSKPVKQEVNGTVILPPLAFPGETKHCDLFHDKEPLEVGKMRREEELKVKVFF